MVTPSDVGSEPSSYERLLDLDLYGGTITDDLNRFSYTRPVAFEALVEAITKSDRTLTRKVLLRWGIWR